MPLPPKGLSEAKGQAPNARLILVNQVGDEKILSEAIRLAKV